MFILALLPPFVAEEMDRSFPSSANGGRLPLGSMAEPEFFQVTADTFAAASTTMRFDRGATTRNKKRRSLTLTDNLTALVFRCPEENCLFQVELIQDGTGSRTIPTPTAVKADGTTAVVINFHGDAFITESTTGNHKDVMTFLYDASAATLREVKRNKGIDES